MRISDRYIGRQVLFGTLFAVVVLSLALVLGNLFKQIRPLLVDKHAPLWLVLRFVLNVLPFSLMFTIPWGFLSAVLLVFGRLSSDQELTSFRVAGVSLARLVVPVFVIAALLSAACLWLNVNVVPQAKASLTELLYEQAKRDPRSLLSPGMVHAGLKDVKFYVEDQQGDSLIGLHLYRTPSASAAAAPVEAYLHARRFTFVVDDAKKELRLKLYDASFETHKPDGSVDMFSAAEAEPYLIPFGVARQEKSKASALTSTRPITASPRPSSPSSGTPLAPRSSSLSPAWPSPISPPRLKGTSPLPWPGRPRPTPSTTRSRWSSVAS